MKIVLLDLKTGRIYVENIPAPIKGSRNVLVKTYYSAVSLGTELRTIKFARSSFIGKARQRPDLVKQVLETVRKSGLMEAFTKVRERINMPFPLGYSISGEVIDVGKDVREFKVGDKVACAGAEYAFHAEINSVPENLCVKLPENVDPRQAAFVAIGAIAIHGIRNAKVSFGEIVAVIGLGLVGLITTQILKATGHNVIGIDVDDRKVELAKQLGVDYVFNRWTSGLEEKIAGLTNGRGVDAAIITASTRSNDPINLAGKIARDKARIVVVGDVGTQFDRETFYRKELELIVSRSYGPGRYDPVYEKQSMGYPIGLVRWTARGNMEEFIRLLSERKIDLEKIITHEYPIDEAPKVYETVLSGSSTTPVIGVVFKYEVKQSTHYSNIFYTGLKKDSASSSESKERHSKVKLGVIGVGAHAIGVILPILRKLKNKVELVGVSSATGISATHTARRYGFKYSTTDYKRVLEDPNIDAVFILTRNSLHTKMTIEAIKHGKHVFVEKPLALSIDELNNIVDVWRRHGKILMVGFNRRYSPFTREIIKYTRDRKNPAMALYRVNAEKLDPTHWIYDPAEGGGRIISELPHFIDYLVYVLNNEPKQVACRMIESGNNVLKMDNFVANIYFADGSLGTILYTSQGCRFFSKEYFELHAEGITTLVKDFRYLTIRGENISVTKRKLFSSDKGHYEEIKTFIEAILEGKRLDQDTKTAFLSTATSLMAYESAKKDGHLISIDQ